MASPNVDTNIISAFSQIHLYNALQAIAIFIVGIIVAKIASTAIKRFLSNHRSLHQVMVLKRLVFYTIFIIFTLSALQHLGFSLSVLLGAAGIFSIAIGFAAQTSISNLISGGFLLAERPFKYGDTIKVGEYQGEIISIDALSIKLKSPDNTMIRIPNEQLLKSTVINISKFPTRRFDLVIGVNYKTDIENFKAITIATAKQNKLMLQEPAPAIYFLNYGDSAINYQISVWVKRENLADIKMSLTQELLLAYQQNNIDIPYPTTTIYMTNQE